VRAFDVVLWAVADNGRFGSRRVDIVIRWPTIAYVLGGDVKKTIVTGMFWLLVGSTGLAQPVETTIDLSPCGGIKGTKCMAFCPQQAEVWASGEMVGPESGYVAVAIDCVTLAPIGKARVAADVVTALCYCPAGNKLYAANSGWYGDHNTLSIIDCATRNTLSRVNVGRDPFGLSYSPVSNKMYCISSWDSCLTVVDCSNDSVVARYAGGHHPSEMLWAPPLNEMYLANNSVNGRDSTVTVVSCESNAVVATICVGMLPYSPCYNSRDEKVYCAGTDPRTQDPKVSVIDCRTHEVTATIPVRPGPQVLCYNSRDNKVYCASLGSTDTSLVVIDGAVDTVLRVLDLPYVVNGLCYDPHNDKVYAKCGYADRVVVIAGATDSVLSEVPTGPNMTALCLDSVRGRVYCLHDTATVTVIDCESDSVLGRVYVGLNNPQVLCYNDSLDRLYSADWPADVAVIDGSTNLVLAQTPVGPHPGALCLNRGRNKLYVACQSSHNVYVLDGLTGAVINAIPSGNTPRALCYDQVRDKVYCANAGSNDITVIACDADTVVATVPAGTGPRALAFNPNNNKVYCTNEWSNDITVVDCTVDTVTSTFPVDRWPFVLSLNAGRNKLYCLCNGGSVASVDCSADTVMARRSIGWVYDICYGSGQDFLYCAASSQTCYVKCIDCRNDSVVATVNVQDRPHALAYDSTSDRVFVSWWNGWPCIGRAAVIDAAQRRVVSWTQWLGVMPTALTWNPQWNRLYVANAGSGSISVVTPATQAISESGDDADLQWVAMPSVIHAALNLPDLPPRSLPAYLLDASGRRVASLHSGSNDVSRIAPGVYFCMVEVEGRRQSKKVVLTR
jgi:YVTN family beta-propeller protein